MTRERKSSKAQLLSQRNQSELVNQKIDAMAETGVEGEPEKRLLTDVQADDFDAERDDKHDKKRAAKLIHQMLDELRIAKGSKPARIASAIAKYDKLTAWSQKRLIASNLAFCAHADNENPYHWEMEAAICDLKQCSSIPSWHSHLFISTAGTSGECALLNGKKYTLEQAFAEMPIPSRQCTNNRNHAGFAQCQCTWMVDLDAVRLERESQPARDAEERAAAIKRLALVGITPEATQRRKAAKIRKETSSGLNRFLLVASILTIWAIIYFVA